MLLFVLHLLGDLLEIGSRSCELRRLSVLQQDFQGPQRVLFLRASSALQTLCIGQVTAIRCATIPGSALVFAFPSGHSKAASMSRDSIGTICPKARRTSSLVTLSARWLL